MKKPSLLLFAIIAFTGAIAQKLPNVQQTGLRAPADVKVDGKATEWGDKLQANNPTTELFYTIANDDNKLYLIAQTDVETVMNRIANGGIKLFIQKNGSKSDAEALFIKYPYLEKGKRITISFSNTRSVTIGNTIRFERAPIPSSPEEAEQIADSLAKTNNKNLTRDLKWIYTNGITGVDSLLSVYNDNGIAAASAVDSKKVLTCEIAIDLKTLGLSAAKGNKFSYHLVVNGQPNKFSPITPTIMGSTAADGTPATAEQVKATNDAMQARFAPRGATTDFWGEYTLAK